MKVFLKFTSSFCLMPSANIDQETETDLSESGLHFCRREEIVATDMEITADDDCHKVEFSKAKTYRGNIYSNPPVLCCAPFRNFR